MWETKETMLKEYFHFEFHIELWDWDDSSVSKYIFGAVYFLREKAKKRAKILGRL